MEKKTIRWDYQNVKNEYTFSHFDTIHERNRQTDRWTNTCSAKCYTTFTATPPHSASNMWTSVVGS